MSAANRELERLKFSYEEDLALYAVRSRIAKKLLEEKVADSNLLLRGKLADMENMKQAMLNLLEDTKAAEEKLAEGKKDVELKVVERTRELKEEQARLLASIESLSFGFVISDTDDRIIVRNSAISRILELAADPTSVRDMARSFSGVASGLDVLTHSCRECIDMRKAVELKEISHGKKYLRVFCSPILVKDETEQDARGRPIGYAMLIEDVTEAKVMERSRDEFFAVASHELRTPLTAIRGNVDMILEAYADKIVDGDMKEMLLDIEASSIRLISIVNDFLEVSRLEQGRFEIKKTRFNVSEIIAKVLRDIETTARQKGLSVAYAAPTSPLPAAYADSNRTEQILFNLVGNAIKFTKSGGVAITAVMAGDFINVRVIDTGDGISERSQMLLFRKFQPAGEEMLARDVTKSTGLGLYISKLIISSMGGTIGLEKSEPGKGSTFLFTLPVAK